MDYCEFKRLLSKDYDNSFIPFIKTKGSVKRESDYSQKKLIKYKFNGDLQKIITEFLNDNEELAEEFKRNKAAERYYIDKWDIPYQEKRDDCHNRNEKIKSIFVNIFRDENKLPATTIIKQCVKSYKSLIEKYNFDEDQVESIHAGVFLLMIAYHLAKKEKIKTEKITPKHSSTKNKKRDSILNNPIARQSGFLNERDYSYYAPVWKYYVNEESFKVELDKLKKENKLGELKAWIEKNKMLIQQGNIFSKKVQEGPHSWLFTGWNHVNLLDAQDPFVRFIFPEKTTDDIFKGFYEYPYFFKGCEKSKLLIDGVDTGIEGYKYLEFPKSLDMEFLDENLKEIWFCDITNKNKSYKKLSMSDLHELAKSYEQLLNDKILKYIQITYQCKNDKIFVSFKTNNFEIPPIVTTEDKFKKLYKKHKDRVLYRGFVDNQDIGLFKKMKQKGISYNVKRHNGQAMGPGVYWSATDEFIKKGTYGHIAAMALALDKLPDTPNENLVRGGKEYSHTFLMRDNQCVIIRPKAVYTQPGNTLTEEQRKQYETNDINVFDTKEEIEDWLECK